MTLGRGCFNSDVEAFTEFNKLLTDEFASLSERNVSGEPYTEMQWVNMALRIASERVVLAIITLYTVCTK